MAYDMQYKIKTLCRTFTKLDASFSTVYHLLRWRLAAGHLHGYILDIFAIGRGDGVPPITLLVISAVRRGARLQNYGPCIEPVGDRCNLVIYKHVVNVGF